MMEASLMNPPCLWTVREHRQSEKQWRQQWGWTSTVSLPPSHQGSAAICPVCWAFPAKNRLRVPEAGTGTQTTICLFPALPHLVLHCLVRPSQSSGCLPFCRPKGMLVTGYCRPEPAGAPGFTSFWSHSSSALKRGIQLTQPPSADHCTRT